MNYSVMIEQIEDHVRTTIFPMWSKNYIWEEETIEEIVSVLDEARMKLNAIFTEAHSSMNHEAVARVFDAQDALFEYRKVSFALNLIRMDDIRKRSRANKKH